MSEPKHVECGWQVMRNGVVITDPVERERCLMETFPYRYRMKNGEVLRSMFPPEYHRVHHPEDVPLPLEHPTGAIDKL